MLIVPKIFEAFPEVVAAQSTREGGRSKEPYLSLNLGLYTGDDPDLVNENRQLFFHELGFKREEVVGAKQVHGDAIKLVTEAGEWEGYDAFITNKAGLLLSVTLADCTPILIYDPVHKAIGAAHSGWKGTVLQIAVKTFVALKEAFGTAPQDCYVYIGCSISKEAFEVGEEVAVQFDDSVTSIHLESGKYHVDLKTANRNMILAAGVPDEQIEVSAYCSYFDNDRFYSYRKENGKCGRMLAVIGLNK